MLLDNLKVHLDVTPDDVSYGHPRATSFPGFTLEAIERTLETKLPQEIYRYIANSSFWVAVRYACCPSDKIINSLRGKNNETVIMSTPHSKIN